MTEPPPPPSSEPDQRSRRMVWLASALLMTYVGLRVLAPHIRVPHPQLAALLGTAVFLVLSLGIVVSAAGISAAWYCEVGVLLAGVLLWTLGGHLKNALVSDVALIVAAIPLGMLVSRAIRYKNLLVPIGAVAALVDLWGVNLGGPVAQVIAASPETAERFVTHVPTFGAPVFTTMVGVGDFAFLAIFFACLHRFRMNVTGSVILAALFCAMGLGVLLVLNPPFNLPGLPFITLGILLPNARHFTFDESERVALLIGGVFLAALLAAGTVAMRKLPPPKAKQAPATQPQTETRR